MTRTTAGPDGPGDRPGRAGGRRARVVAVAAAVALVGVGVALVAPDGRAPAAAGRVLPEELADLPAQRSDASEELSARLAARLAAEPSVRDVAVRAYGVPGQALVVLDLSPRTAFTDTSAGELAARLLGAAAPQGATSDEVRSAASDDGRALVTCSTPQPGTSTCVSVEADRALVVLTSGGTGDPVRLVTGLRDEVRAAEDR